MPDQQMGPERLSPKGIPSARRGYDRKAVESLLEEARLAWTALQQEQRRLLEEIDRAGGLEYLGRDLGGVGRDVERLLADAQETARGLRERARADSTERLTAATAEAQRLVSEAEEQAYRLRGDAWETGMDLLHDAAETARELVEEAEAEVLITRAGAEQEAYRLVASARRESQDLLREARFAAERAVLEARAQAEYLEPVDTTEPGPKQGESAPAEREEPGRRHRRPPRATPMPTTDVIRVIRPEQEERPPARPGADPGSYGDALAAEVEALWETGDTEAVSGALEPPPAAAATTPGPPDEQVPAQPPAEGPSAGEAAPVAEEVPAPEAPGTEEAPPPEPAAGAPPGEESAVPGPPPAASASDGAAASGPGGLEEIFARLRETHRPSGRRRRTAPPVGETLPGLGEPAPGEAPTADRGAVPDAIELRERLVLPVQNRALRRAKENLLELQNGALDALRVSGSWEGGEPTLAALTTALESVAEEAAEAGAQAAGAFAGGEPPAPVIGRRSADMVQEMAGQLAGQVAAAAAEAKAADTGPLELAAGVSRVFRAWRGEEAEHWVRAVAYAAYHDSLLAGLAVAGVRSVAPVAHGLLCAECPALGGAVWDPAGDPPEGTVCPPAHPDCVCTVAPTASP